MPLGSSVVVRWPRWASVGGRSRASFPGGGSKEGGEVDCVGSKVAADVGPLSLEEHGAAVGARPGELAEGEGISSVGFEARRTRAGAAPLDRLEARPGVLWKGRSRQGPRAGGARQKR